MIDSERAAALAEIETLIALSEEELIGEICKDDPDDEAVSVFGDGTPSQMTFGHIRRARAALAAIRKGEPA